MRGLINTQDKSQDRSRAITAIFGTGPLELEILPTFWGKLGKINILLRMPFFINFYYYAYLEGYLCYWCYSLSLKAARF